MRRQPFLSAQSGGHEVWNAIQIMVKNLSEAMLSPLPNFWRISKSFMEGRYKKVVVYLPNYHPLCTNITSYLERIELLAPQPNTMPNDGTRYREAVHCASL